jgi:hypothetical protein
MMIEYTMIVLVRANDALMYSWTITLIEYTMIVLVRLDVVRHTII